MWPSAILVCGVLFAAWFTGVTMTSWRCMASVSASNRGNWSVYIGPNGAGKSTTIKILSGILTPSGGRCEVEGLTPWEDRARHVAGIGVVFGQRTQLWWDLPVIESYELLRDIYRLREALFRETLDEFVTLLDLAPLLDVPVRQLSLGQRMRCDLAASLLHRPRILFLDEPTIGMDVVSKLAIRDFIKRFEHGARCGRCCSPPTTWTTSRRWLDD